MKKAKIIFLTLVITLLLTFSTINITADKETTTNDICKGIATSEASEKLIVEKMVRTVEGECPEGYGEWKETVTVEPGDQVHFRINVTYYNTTAGEHWAYNINITDILPVVNDKLCLEYLEMIQGIDPVVWGDFNEKLSWVYSASFHLMDGETISLIFSAEAKGYCECCNENLENKVFVTADEQCTGLKLEGEDSAFVNIECPEPDINVIKKVWNNYDEKWVKTAYGLAGSDIRFNITVENTGDCTLTTVTVNDTLPDGLEYNNLATPTDPVQNGNYLIWTFYDLEPNQKIYIEFNVTIDEDGIAGILFENTVKVTGEIDNGCFEIVTDQDNAFVKVSGMLLEKQVWNEQENKWDKETKAAVGGIVEFRIKIKYYGDYTLYNIEVEDILPECLKYELDSANPEPTEVDDQKIKWVITSPLGNEETFTITFKAEVVGYDPCEECLCVNLVKVWAKECSGEDIYKEDTATVNIICKMVAKAGGPYEGIVGEPVTITGEAINAVPPVTYEWDLNNDGVYDKTGNPITHTWTSPGTYTIKLRATDNLGSTDTDSTTVTITLINDPPTKPTIDGPTSGLKANQEYTYKFRSTDPDGDQIRYQIKWGDGSSEWTEYVNSSEWVELSNSWPSKNTNYNIEARAEDIHGAKSDWSTLTVATPKGRSTLLPLPNLILTFGFDVDVKPVQLEPGEDYVDIEILSKPLFMFGRGFLQVIYPGEFVRLYNAKGLFSPQLPFCVGVFSEYAIIG